MSRYLWYRKLGAWVARGQTAPPPPPPPPPSSGGNFAGHQPNRVLLGFCVQDSSTSILPYDQAKAYAGVPYVRRSFGGGSWITAAKINQWLDECSAEGIYPWISFKVPSTGNGLEADWQKLLTGAYDADLDVVKERATARSEKWAITVHHEPMDTYPLTTSETSKLQTWSTMQRYLSDYLAPVNTKVALAAIANGHAWGPKAYKADAINLFYPQSTIDKFKVNKHIIASDTYDSGDPTQLAYWNGTSGYDRTSLKMQGFVDWCRDKGVNACAIGEYGVHTAEDLRRCWNIAATNVDIYPLSVYFNSAANARANWLLVPDSFDAVGTDRDGTPESEAKLNYWKQMIPLSAQTNPPTIP